MISQTTHTTIQKPANFFEACLAPENRKYVLLIAGIAISTIMNIVQAFLQHIQKSISEKATGNLEGKLESLTREKEALEGKLAEKTTRAEGLQAQLAEKTAEVKNLQTQLAEKTAEAKGLQAQLETLKAEIARNKTEAADREQYLENEIRHLERSKAQGPDYVPQDSFERVVYSNVDKAIHDHLMKKNPRVLYTLGEDGAPFDTKAYFIPRGVDDETATILRNSASFFEGLGNNESFSSDGAPESSSDDNEKQDYPFFSNLSPVSSPEKPEERRASSSDSSSSSGSFGIGVNLGDSFFS